MSFRAAQPGSWRYLVYWIPMLLFCIVTNELLNAYIHKYYFLTLRSETILGLASLNQGVGRTEMFWRLWGKTHFLFSLRLLEALTFLQFPFSTFTTSKMSVCLKLTSLVLLSSFPHLIGIFKNFIRTMGIIQNNNPSSW